MATEIEAASLLTRKASGLKKQNVTTIGAMAKYKASEVYVSVANEAFGVLGGYGFTKTFQKFLRTQMALLVRVPVKSKSWSL